MILLAADGTGFNDEQVYDAFSANESSSTSINTVFSIRDQGGIRRSPQGFPEDERVRFCQSKTVRLQIVPTSPVGAVHQVVSVGLVSAIPTNRQFSPHHVLSDGTM
jgi:hypothetical protein